MVDVMLKLRTQKYPSGESVMARLKSTPSVAVSAASVGAINLRVPVGPVVVPIVPLPASTVGLRPLMSMNQDPLRTHQGNNTGNKKEAFIQKGAL